MPPSSVFRTWIDGPALGAVLDGITASLSSKVKTRLAELADLLMWPTLTYMTGRGDAVFREEVATFEVS